MTRWLQSGNYRRFTRGGRGAIAISLEMLRNYHFLGSNGDLELIKGKKGDSRKAPTESPLPNKVYAYANTNNVLKAIVFTNDNGEFQKQIGGDIQHFKNKKQKKEYTKLQKAIKTNNPKKGRMGKSIKSEIEKNIHIHLGIDHKKSKVRHKLSAKERRLVYESVDMARKKGVAIWQK